MHKVPAFLGCSNIPAMVCVFEALVGGIEGGLKAVMELLTQKVRVQRE